MLNRVRDFYFNALIKSAQDYLKEFDKKSGRFLENGGWAITRQDPMLAYAYLYLTKGDSNTFYRSADALSVVIKAVKALRDFQYPDGQLEFIKTDGSTFGPIYMPWTFYHWLETYELLKNEITPELKKDWEIGLLPAFNSFYNGDSSTEQSGNIKLWNVMSLHRAGIIFKREEWIKKANDMILPFLDEQKPEGYWEEFNGPTTGYNHVYIHALGLYRFHGGIIDVTDVLKKAIHFHQAFTYPDGSAVETLDGRRQYHKQGWSGQSVVLPSGFPGLIATRGGIKLLSSRFKYIDTSKVPLPHAASLLIMLDSLISDAEFASRFIDEDLGYKSATEKTFSVRHGKAGVVRRAGAEAVLSAYTTPVLENDWSLDRCSLVSVWTEKSGLLLGSGNSKSLINHSSFVIVDKKNGQIAAHIPINGELISENEVVLDYGKAVCKIKTEISEKGEISLSYSAETCFQDYDWYINLPLRPDFTFKDSDINVIRRGNTNIISFLNTEVRFRGNMKIKMPSYSPTPYFKHDKSKIDEWLAIVSVFPNYHEIVIKIKQITE